MAYAFELHAVIAHAYVLIAVLVISSTGCVRVGGELARPLPVAEAGLESELLFPATIPAGLLPNPEEQIWTRETPERVIEVAAEVLRASFRDLQFETETTSIGNTYRRVLSPRFEVVPADGGRDYRWIEVGIDTDLSLGLSRVKVTEIACSERNVRTSPHGWNVWFSPPPLITESKTERARRVLLKILARLGGDKSEIRHGVQRPNQG